LASVASMVSHGLGVAILPIPIAANEVHQNLNSSLLISLNINAKSVFYIKRVLETIH